MGPNGAGKSTPAQCPRRRDRADQGQGAVRRPAAHRAPAVRDQPARGVARVFQTPEIFGDLTVIENVMMAMLSHRDGAFRLRLPSRFDERGQVGRRAAKALADLGLGDHLHHLAGALSRGDDSGGSNW
ncbi:MAG: ATP-binding cassette domain-containing protein [Rhodopseudomonas palustris]|nr:ATP-binding cassette domain-containing protein [Rhodopseudomonas palustris]